MRFNPDWLPDCVACKHTAPEHASEKPLFSCMINGCNCKTFEFPGQVESVKPDYKALLIDIVAAMDKDDGHSDFSTTQLPLEEALARAYNAIHNKEEKP